MEDRSLGFLRPPERNLADAYRASTDSPETPDKEKLSEIRDPVETKSRMKSSIATPEALRETLATIHRDLKRVEAYHRRVKDQPGGRWEWSDQILPRIQFEVDKMARLMDSWEHKADREGEERVRSALSDALNPLHTGLDDLERALDGEFTPKEIELARSGHKDAPEGLADDLQELKSRRVALLELLKDQELRVIFQYIGTHEGEPLPDRKKGDNGWKWWISLSLESEHELVEESAWGYQLRERGELVDQVLWNLEDQPLLEMLGEGRMSTAEAALQLLPHHVRADLWDAWDEV
jgi:hypothetical protein